MNFFFSKTYKIGRLTVSIFSNEISIIYLSRNRVIIKKFKRFEPAIRKKFYYAFASGTAAMVLLFLFWPASEVKALTEDDKIKNKLLLSSQTDFSSPEVRQKLAISKYIVKKGESLPRIAKKFGVSVDTICGSNNLKTYENLPEGTVLNIPNKDGILYKMPTGSNIVNVAKSYNVSLEKIIAENSIRNPDFIPKDIVLFIPDAKPKNIFNGFLWPTASRFVTCGYGWRRNPFDYSVREFHQGLDIRCDYEGVKSSRYGQVTFTGWMGGYGMAIIIAHPNGWKTLYAHLSRIMVKPGQYVKQGQLIARSGNTGRSTGAHLHFEMIKDGAHKNPYGFLARKKIQ